MVDCWSTKHLTRFGAAAVIIRCVTKPSGKADIGRRLAQELARLGKTKTELAVAMEMSLQSVGAWIKTGRIDRKHHPAMMKLGIDVPWVLTAVGQPGKPRLADFSPEALEIARLYEMCPASERESLLKRVRNDVQMALNELNEEKRKSTTHA